MDIEFIKSKLDIVAIIKEYLPNIVKAGNNYKTICPFHNEKTPSFMISTDLQIFKCFGCGLGGDVIKFVQEYEKVSFYEALKICAQKAGIDINNYHYEDNKIKEEKQRLIELNLIVAKYYNYVLKNLEQGRLGLKYANKRKITMDLIDKFVIGYAPNNIDNLKRFLNKKGYKDIDLVKWGFLVQRNRKYLDKFRHRLIQPIFNQKGEVVGFIGRYIGSSSLSPKYLNSPDTILFKKSQTLYGLYHAKEAMRRTSFVILQEGSIDVLSSHRVGVENIVAPLGTSFTLEQAQLLKKFVDTIYFAFDTDTAGINALIRAIGIVEQIGLNHKAIDIMGYKDPDELISSDPNLWITKVSNPVDTVDYLIKYFIDTYGIDSFDLKNKFLNFMLSVFRNLRNQVAISHYAKVVSDILDISVNVFVDHYLKKSNDQLDKSNLYSINKKSKTSIYSRNSYNDIIDRREIYFLSLIYNSKIVPSLDIDQDIFQNEITKYLFAKICDLILNKITLMDLDKSLSPEQKEVLHQVLMMDLSSVKDVKIEIEKVFKLLKQEQIKRQIHYLSLINDENAIIKINDLVKQLKNYI
ncbi:MAG: DNA primase [Candidatus Dojkabacteria bacterium]|nr:DNA primase [Candidatus Dojkabacteria bacterium]